MTPLHVGLDLHHLGTRQTGNQTYVRELATALAEEAAPDLTLTGYVAGPVSDPPPLRLEPLRPSARWLRLPWSLPRALARDRVDVAHLPYIVPGRCPCPAVITVHDISYEPHPEFFRRADVARWRRLVPRSCRAAAHVITVSEHSRQDLAERYGVPAEKLTVTPEAPGRAFRRIEDEGAVAEAGARHGSGRPWVLGLGNLAPRKNLERVVAAFGAASTDGHLDHDLLLVGPDAGSRSAVSEAARRAGVADRVHVTGWIDLAELVLLLNGATALAYPSLYEGFGLPVVEAMACGTPVITSDVSALPETAGGAALLVDPTDTEDLAHALGRVAGDADLAADLRARGLSRAAELSWRRTALLTADVYRRVAGR
jgi:glycosyltransferase involved in cell wall biosynthesis